MRILEDLKIFFKQTGQPKIKTLFIGGGTPSSIPLDLLEDFLIKIRKIFVCLPGESTIELNPETVTRDLLRVLSENGITRVSIGIQSLDDKVLYTLGRNTDAFTTQKGLEVINKNWEESFSVDLINTVPGQSVDSALSDIKNVNDFEPDHISLYSLSFEPSTKLYTLLQAGKITSVSESVDLDMQKESIQLLESFGYKRYEISNYTKKEKQSLHNLNYWKMGSYLGIGPSAASTLLTNTGPVRLEYKRSIANFVSELSLKDRMYIEYIKPKSFLLEHFMMGFRLVNGIDKEHISSVFNINVEKYLEPVLNIWKDKLILSQNSIRLNNSGLSLLNLFLSDIAGLIESNPVKISGKGINWPL